MTDRKETDGQADDRREPLVRRPWHAPRFYAADMSLTDNTSNAFSDGAMVSPSSS